MSPVCGRLNDETLGPVLDGTTLIHRWDALGRWRRRRSRIRCTRLHSRRLRRCCDRGFMSGITRATTRNQREGACEYDQSDSVSEASLCRRLLSHTLTQRRPSYHRRRCRPCVPCGFAVGRVLARGDRRLLQRPFVRATRALHAGGGPDVVLVRRRRALRECRSRARPS